MNNLQKTLSNCEEKVQKFFDYEIKLTVLPKNPSSLQCILDYCIQQSGASKNDLLAGKQSRKVSEARQIYCYLAKKHTEYSLTAIGKFINKDHSTVIYSIKTVTDLLQHDKIFINTYSQIINEFTTIPTNS